ncbi:hypothetical protein ACETRX_04235 [Labrys portucalensis]|uniref:Uncharacterized protein n=1 Tax=Labrys neptuniae TaxID=376174 RepID=A0ABV6Z9G2_9HYPH
MKTLVCAKASFDPTQSPGIAKTRQYKELEQGSVFSKTHFALE